MQYIESACVCHQNDRVAPPPEVKEGETAPAPLFRYCVTGDSGTSWSRIKKYVVAHDESEAVKLVAPFVPSGVGMKFDCAKLPD